MNESQIDIKSDSTSTSVQVTSGGEFARMIASFRGRHLVADAPAYAGGPGEAATPPELMLSAVGACALGMFDLVCSRDGIPLRKCTVNIKSDFSGRKQEELGVSVYDKISIKFLFEGITREQAETLVNIYHANCPIYGSVKVASHEVVIEFETR